jgi:hypothetical protein
MDEAEVVETERAWTWEKTIPVDPGTFDPSMASERLMKILTDAGLTYNGGPPELSIATMDGSGMTISVNCDQDPTGALASIRKLPLLPAEARLQQAQDRMKAYAAGMAAGTQPTAKQMAAAILDLAIIVRGTG